MISLPSMEELPGLSGSRESSLSVSECSDGKASRPAWMAISGRLPPSSI